MPCQCPSCTRTPAPTYSEAWRRETEARWCLTQPRQARQAYYVMVKARRGGEALAALIAEVRALYACAS